MHRADQFRSCAIARRVEVAAIHKHDFLSLRDAEVELTGPISLILNQGANILIPIDTVPPSESKSRRWKSPSTPDMSALSAARPPLRDTPLASGTARPATRPSPEEHTLCRTFNILL